MAGTPTTNYSFPTYAEQDPPNLAGAYNEAMTSIDSTIKGLADRITTLEGEIAQGDFTGTSQLTVADLAGLKLNDGGYAGKDKAV